MDIVRGLDALPLPDGPSVNDGFFDGVHLGHQEVFRRTVEAARSGTLGACRDVRPASARDADAGRSPGCSRPSNGKPPRSTRAASMCWSCSRSRRNSRSCPRNLRSRRARRHARGAHWVGANFTSGTPWARSRPSVRREPLGMTADDVDLFELEGRVVSSSSIRDALASGDLAWPRTALGRRYGVDGEVVAGAGRGKGLGYLTANLRTWPRPSFLARDLRGVAELQDGNRYLAAIDVGTNPTFGTEPLHVEAFLLDFPMTSSEDTLTVGFWKRLRDEVKFDSIDELIAAIADDVERTHRSSPFRVSDRALRQHPQAESDHEDERDGDVHSLEETVPRPHDVTEEPRRDAGASPAALSAGIAVISKSRPWPAPARARPARPSRPSPSARRPCRARRSPTTDPRSPRGPGSWTPIAAERARRDRGETWPPRSTRDRNRTRAEPPFQRRREHDRARSERREPRRHQVRVGCVLSRRARCARAAPDSRPAAAGPAARRR